MTQRYVAAEAAYQRLAQIMSTEVSIPVSDGENAKYDEDDLHRSLIALSMDNAYAESGMDSLAVRAASMDVPSGSWVRDAVGRVEEKEMEEKVQRALSSTLDQLKIFGIFTTPIIAGLDKHKLPRYDEGMEPFLRRSKKERGTTKFEFYASLQSVEEGRRRAQICCEQFGFFDENDEIVERMLAEGRLRGVDVSLLLMDREFFSTGVINRLKKLRQLFLMPCRLTKGMKQAVMEHAQGTRKMVSKHAIRSSDDDHEEASFTLVIFPRRGCEDETDPLKRYIAFATNIPMDKILWNISRLPKDYRQRWGIETGYSGIEQFRARTTSRKHSLRLLYFFYAMILYNAWLLANLTLARSICKELRDPIITVQVLKAVFETVILESFCKDG
jgi:hypothetical protein